MTESLDARLDAVFTSRADALADPYSIFNEVRDTGRIYEHGPALLVCHHEDVRELVRDNVRLSSNAGQQGTRAQAVRLALSEEHRIVFDEVAAVESNFITRADGEQHDRLRRITHRAFTPRRVAELTSSIQRYVDELIEPLLEGEIADLAPLAYQLPLMAICDMLGVPAQDRELIHEWSAALGRNRQGLELEPLLDAHAAHRHFRAYVDAMADDYRGSASLSSDLVGALLDAEQDERLTDAELAATFVILLFAGHETTTNLIGIGLLELLRRPDQWQALTEDLSLVPGAVEELLRFVTPVQWIVRVTTQEMEIAGERVGEGRTVIPVLAAANRDPVVFRDPEHLDILRPEARQHVAFGLGPHFCLGASLARLEGAIALGTLARRFPRMELATDSFQWGGNTQMRHIMHLPAHLGGEREAAGSEAVIYQPFG